MNNGTTAGGATATIERILQGWPDRIDDGDLSQLSGLSAEQAKDLSEKMMAASTPSRSTAVHITSLASCGFLHSSRKGTRSRTARYSGK